MRPELDNHWALRDFAARLMAQICKNFNTSTNNLQTRVTRLFSSALQNEKTQLSSLYGAVAGLSELGTEVIKVFIVPRLRFVSDRIEPQLQGGSISNTDKIAAGHIRAMLQKTCSPVLKTMRNAPDLIDDYKRDYGFLGLTLHQAVVKARNAPPSLIAVPAGATAASTNPSMSSASAGTSATNGAGSASLGTASGTVGGIAASSTVGSVPIASNFVSAASVSTTTTAGGGRIIVGGMPGSAAATGSKVISIPAGAVRQAAPLSGIASPAAVVAGASALPAKYVIVQRPLTPSAVQTAGIIGANTTVGSLVSMSSVRPLNVAGRSSVATTVLVSTHENTLCIPHVYVSVFLSISSLAHDHNTASNPIPSTFPL